MRNRSQETGDDGENPSEADPEHLRIPQGQLAEYRRGLQQVHNQNRLQELYKDPVELKEGVELNPSKLDKLKVRILMNDGNIKSSC